MKLISWNLNGLEDQNIDERTEAAMFRILLGASIKVAMKPNFKPNSPDIIVLQEVVERSYHAHIVPHLKAAGFSIFPPSPPERSYFEVIATRNNNVNANYTPFNYSDQGRGLTTLQLEDVTIMTSHLESLKSGKICRIEQAQFIIEKMEKSGPCIFAGDTNLREEEWESLDQKSIKDAWVSIGSPKSHRITWHHEHIKSRFDRVWVKQLEVKTFETLGKEKIQTINEYPSDHFGLYVDYK